MNSNFQARGSRGEIWLYDPIGANMWGDSISAKSFQKELSALGKVDTINLRINSPGGDVFDGFSIYNQLKAHPAKIIVDIDGVAASISSIIAMAGDTINIAKNAMIMIHDPQGVAIGDASEMQRVAALLDTVKGNLAETYVDRTGNKRADIEAWMTEETWLTADAAVQYRFADKMTEASKVTAFFDMKNFRNVPDTLKQRMQAAAPSPALDIRRGIVAEHEKRVQALCRP
jgi:ATP-dependent Clp protease protease subunit